MKSKPYYTTPSEEEKNVELKHGKNSENKDFFGSSIQFSMCLDGQSPWKKQFQIRNRLSLMFTVQNLEDSRRKPTRGAMLLSRST